MLLFTAPVALFSYPIYLYACICIYVYTIREYSGIVGVATRSVYSCGWCVGVVSRINNWGENGRESNTGATSATGNSERTTKSKVVGEKRKRFCYTLPILNKHLEKVILIPSTVFRR